MNAKTSGSSQETAAAQAGISTRTAQRIAAGTHRPQWGRLRNWPTRADPFDGIWERELQPLLEQEPRLEPDCAKRKRFWHRHEFSLPPALRRIPIAQTDFC